MAKNAVNALVANILAKTKLICSSVINNSNSLTTTNLGSAAGKRVRSENTSLFVILYLVVVMILGDKYTLAIKCVCNPQECDVIRSEDCPGKGYIVWDPCK